VTELTYLRTPAAIRERAEKMLKYVEDGRSAWFALDGDGLEAAVQATLDVTRQRFPNPSDIPFHSRWRHFEAGGHDRWGALAERLSGVPADEIARRILANGYSSRSKTFADYVRRLLKQDGRFVANAKGLWMLRAAA